MIWAALFLAASAHAQQPQSFSHRIHAERKIACAACHPGAASSAKAGIVARAACIDCHRRSGVVAPAAIRLSRTSSPLRWEPVHELPGWVRFSHARHKASSCSLCHGRVELRDEAQEEVAMHMNFCRDCHLKTRARAGCGTCHREKDAAERRP